MKNLLSSTLALLSTLPLTGCAISLSPADEFDHEHLETHAVDGWPETGLELSSHFGTVRVEPTEGENRLAVVLHENTPGDASVELQEGRLVLSTKSGEKAAIGDVTLFTRDPLPALQLATGMGDVRVEGVEIKGPLVASSGMGDVSIRRLAAVESVDLDSGMGSVEAVGFTCGTLSLDSGMGNVKATDMQATHATLETGMGNVGVTRSTFEVLDGGTGMGNVNCEETTYGSGSLQSGMGRVKEG